MAGQRRQAVGNWIYNTSTDLWEAWDGDVGISSMDLLSVAESTDVMAQILKELKIMNLHLSLITDSVITNAEVD
jgi:hypothetical protein